MSSQQRDESNINAAEVRARMRLYEDHNLAYRLQQQEYDSHYGRNRAERQLIGTDTRRSRFEQDRERDEARQRHLITINNITAHDEHVAQQLQLEIEREAQMMKQMQLRRDEELAKRLAEEEQRGVGVGSTAYPPPPPPSNPIPSMTTSSNINLPRATVAQSTPTVPSIPVAVSQGSELQLGQRPIRDLLTGDELNLDESTQNELNRMADASYAPLDSLITMTEYPRHITTFGVHSQQPQATTNPLDVQRGPMMGSPSQQFPPFPPSSLSPTPQSIPHSATATRRVQGVPLPGLANPRLSLDQPREQEDAWPAPPPLLPPPQSQVMSISEIPQPQQSIVPSQPYPQAVLYDLNVRPSSQITSTNPFLMDLMQNPVPQMSQQPPPYPTFQPSQPNPLLSQRHVEEQPPQYFSEFGLPPPSNLALGHR